MSGKRERGEGKGRRGCIEREDAVERMYNEWEGRDVIAGYV